MSVIRTIRLALFASFAVLTVAGAPVVAQQSLTPEELTARTIHRRALDAVI